MTKLEPKIYSQMMLFQKSLHNLWWTWLMKWVDLIFKVELRLNLEK